MSDFTKKKKQYVKGSAKAHNFDDGGQLINVDFNLAALGELPITPTGYVKITLSKLKEKDRFGNDYSMYVNDFVPQKQTTNGSEKSTSPAAFTKAKAAPTTDDLPF